MQNQGVAIVWRVALSGAAGLIVLLGLAHFGGCLKQSLHLTLPGPVIGLALLAIIFLAAKRFHARFHNQLADHVGPIGKTLISHMGLLFVPAGVGIVAQGDLLQREWLPIVAALLGSTIAGLLATGWVMQWFGAGPKKN